MSGRISYGGSPSLPGVQILRFDHVVQELRIYLDFYDVTVVTQTAGRLHYRRTEIESRPRRVFLGEPGELFASDPRGLPETIRCLLIQPRDFEALAEELGHRPGAIAFDVIMADDPDLVDRLRRFHRAAESGASALEVESRYVDAMRRVLERHSRAAPAELSEGREVAAVARVRRVLEERLEENITLDELAREAGLSRLKLFRAFRRATGLPPHEYQIQRRVAAARPRLMRHEPVIDVAIDLGFCDQAHFTRHFRRIMGVPPKAFALSFAPSR